MYHSAAFEAKREIPAYWVWASQGFPRSPAAGSAPEFSDSRQHLGEVVVADPAVSFGQVLQVDLAAHDAGQRALRAAFIGFFVDMFDVYLPVVALGPAISYFQPATLSPALKSTLFYVVFALSLVGRPVGATLFGHYGDKLGRRWVAIISMGGFAVVTLFIGAVAGL